MFSLIILGISTGVCIWGIILIFQGLRQKIDDYKAVPISSITEINNLSGVNEEPVKISPIALEKNEKRQKDREEEAMKTPPEKAVDEKVVERFEEKLIEQERIFKEKIADLQQENNTLKEALEREVSNKNGEEDDKESAEPDQETVERLRLSEAANERLTQENTQVKEQLSQMAAKNEDLNQKVNQFNEEIQRRESDENQIKEKIEQSIKEEQRLQEENAVHVRELALIKSELLKMSASDNARLKKIEELELQVEQLKNRPQESKAIDVETEENFKIQIQNLRLEVNRSEQERKQLINDHEENEKILREKLDQALEKVRLIESKKELKGQEEDQLSEQPDGSMFPIVDLKNENNRLLQDKNELEKYYHELKEFNNRLVEKERILHYELTKSRAQNLGLEKICEEFKNQIEHGNAGK